MLELPIYTKATVVLVKPRLLCFVFGLFVKLFDKILALWHNLNKYKVEGVRSCI